MARFNDGDVYTNEKCVGCGKCVSACASLGSNVSIYKDGTNRYEVGKRCIECGACVGACPHGARSYRDDTELFFRDLREGKKISIIIDPAFYIDYPDTVGKAITYLHSLGIEKVYDGSVGAEISMWMHAKYMRSAEAGKTKGPRAIIANVCSVFTKYVQSYKPEVLPYIIPVRPASAAMRVYVRKYLKDTNRIAYLTPCIAKDGEGSIYDPSDKFDYRVTFAGFTDATKDIDFDDYPAGKADVEGFGVGRIAVSLAGYESGIKDLVSRSIVAVRFATNSDALARLMVNIGSSEEKELPELVLIGMCQGGCIYGSGIDISTIDDKKSFIAYSLTRKDNYSRIDINVGSDEYFRIVDEYYIELGLNPADFEYRYANRYQQRFQVPEHTLNEIYNLMNKTTEQKRKINCGACGYPTCEQMAIAVADGYANKQDCIHYLNDNLYEMTFRDNVFDVYNSNGFVRELDKLISSNPDNKYAVVVANINRLRDVNNLYGRSAGDRILAYSGELFRDFSEEVGIVARLQGSLFAFAFEYSEKKMKRLQSHRDFNVSYQGITHYFSVRFGIVIAEGIWKDVGAEALLEYAYYASDLSVDRSSNSFIFFAEDMVNRMNLEMRITDEMKNAKRNGEYVLYVQPQYSHSEGKLVGAEILSRWIRRDGTFVMPGDFISVFEKNGFIKEFDKYIWESTFKLVKKWEDEGVNIVPVSVNISRYSIADERITDTIHGLYKKYPINKSHLHFEITESAYIEEQKLVSERISKLRKQGFIVAMDDFGSGYSSLNSLKDIPVDILKLDMGFVRGDRYSERGMCIIKYMIEMANALGLSIIAEGVETKEMADAIAEAGCDTIQGYLYAKPMPVVK